MEEAHERCAIPPLREMLRREYDERLRGRPRDKALEKWGPGIEAEILEDLHRFSD
jgi:hypothetical protein